MEAAFLSARHTTDGGFPPDPRLSTRSTEAMGTRTVSLGAVVSAATAGSHIIAHTVKNRGVRQVVLIGKVSNAKHRYGSWKTRTDDDVMMDVSRTRNYLRKSAQKFATLSEVNWFWATFVV